MRRLIVNADDLGMTSGVNRGIIDCHRAGTVTSATLMVNGVAAAEAAELAGENPELGVGLHLNLTSGTPSSRPEEVRSLLGSTGMLPGMPEMLKRLSTGKVRREELRREVAAQIDACREFGVEPTHVDSHHHLHAHPLVRAELAGTCRRMGITRARGYKLLPRNLKALGVRLAWQLPGRGERLAEPDRLAGIEEMGKRDIATMLRRELAAPGDVLEFMCHPGYTDSQLEELTSYNRLRQVELRALMSEEVIALIRRTGVELISFRDL